MSLARILPRPAASLILAGCLSVFLSPSILLASDDEQEGLKLFVSNCGACHQLKPVSHDAMIAPLLFAVRDHYIKLHATEEAFVEAVAAWVKKPDPANALMPGAIRRFQLMPALAIDDEVVREIAEFIYEYNGEIPDWYEQHYQEEHGTVPSQGDGQGGGQGMGGKQRKGHGQGMGKGRGQGMGAGG